MEEEEAAPPKPVPKAKPFVKKAAKIIPEPVVEEKQQQPEESDQTKVEMIRDLAVSVRSKLHDLSHAVKGCNHRHQAQDSGDSSDDERLDRRHHGRRDVYSSDDESDREVGFEDS